MTREDIIRMARDAGWNGIYAKPLFSIYMQETNFLHFAALVAAAEREECAKLCEAHWLPKMAADIRSLGKEE